MNKNPKHISILGSGESGMGAAVLARSRGISYYLSDSGELKEERRAALRAAGLEWHEGGHDTAQIRQSDYVVKSPGIPEKAPIVQQIRQWGIPVISEIEMASHFTQKPIVAITGSNGKTTTTALTSHILKHAGLKVGMGGNIGNSFARLVSEDSKYDCYVIEVSSFQLDDIVDFHPHIAIITNITPDHLDRYDYKLENYRDAKLAICRNMQAGDSLIWCFDDPISKTGIEALQGAFDRYPISLEQELPQGAFLDNNQSTIHLRLKSGDHMKIEDVSIQGKHNTYNSMAASLSARLLKVRKSTIRESLTNFDTLEHRLESVASIRGVEFINDSKATNVNSCWYALESVSAPIIWIAGGVDKGNDYTQLSRLVQQKVKALICLGTDNAKLLDEFTGKVDVITETRSMEQAVKTAYSFAKKGETVILSPCCASFDLFENYEDRGEQFKYWVRQL